MFRIIGERRLQDGEIIFAEGDPSDDIFRVKSGCVAITKELGGRTIVLETLRSGEVFGEMAFVTDSARTASARAMGSAVIGLVDKKPLQEELNTVSPALYQMFECLTLRLRKTTDAAAGVNLVRREPRISRTWFVAFKHHNMDLEAYSHNASCGGMFIKTPNPLARGERIRLNLQLPGEEEPMQIISEVAWVRKTTTDNASLPKGMGVKFLNVNQKDHEKLQKALEADASGNVE